MSPAHRGATPITGVYRGAVPIKGIYRGAVPLWPLTGAGAGGIGDNFEGSGPLQGQWQHEDLLPHDYVIGRQDGRARVLIPDGEIGSVLVPTTCNMRWDGPLNNDDGIVECRVASLGSGMSVGSVVGYNTDVYGRGYKDGCSYGVGIRMVSGHCWIVLLHLGLASVQKDCGTFQPGAVLRLKMVGFNFWLSVDGKERGHWDDSFLAVSERGVDYRSLLIRQDAAKDLLGPRRFSPDLDYVRYYPL